MHSALLADGKMVSAKAFDAQIHGVRITCIDKSCHAPVHHISATKDVAAHFKTSGRNDSVHASTCGFAKKLSFQESVAKVGEYQTTLGPAGIREFVVRLNMSKLDPDYEAKDIHREPSQKEKEAKEEIDGKALKESKPTPQSIGSLKTVKNLFTSVEPDLLASIIISYKGNRIPISDLIRSQSNAHEALWAGDTLDMPYFIHGKVDRVIRRDKVWFITFDEGYFSLVVFEKHFKHFTLKDDKLIGEDILAFGYLKKNDYNKEKKMSEMIIKSDKYIEFL